MRETRFGRRKYPGYRAFAALLALLLVCGTIFGCAGAGSSTAGAQNSTAVTEEGAGPAQNPTAGQGEEGSEAAAAGQGETAAQTGDKVQEPAAQGAAAGTSVKAPAELTEPESGEDETAGDKPAQSESAQAEDMEPEASAALTVEEDGTYTSKDEVALYLHLYGRLPSNFITKKEAEALGWKQKPGKEGELSTVAPGKSIGGSRFGNYEEKLPKKKGRSYSECDIDYTGGNRNAKRLVYSNDGLIFYTEDHYETFEQLYPTE